MSAERLAATVLWTELVQAMRKDGYDIPDQAGVDTSQYLQRVARDVFGLEARTPAGVSDITRQLIERDAHGQRKYGTSLDRTDLTLGDWLQHQAEELMDGAGYALAAKREYERLQQPLPDPNEFLISYPPIFVSKQQVLDWRKAWMVDNPAPAGEDHVTPFDHLLYQALPYDAHTQRLRSACSNIKWSEVPLAKLEAVAAVLCEYGL